MTVQHPTPEAIRAAERRAHCLRSHAMWSLIAGVLGRDVAPTGVAADCR